jgi:hypothetical protein
MDMLRHRTLESNVVVPLIRNKYGGDFYYYDYFFFNADVI